MKGIWATITTIVKLHLLHKYIPLFVSWNITFRCNLRCLYCASCDAPKEELPTDEVIHGLDALWRVGTRWITFGGGEPLVRSDMGEILQYSRKKGFQTYISTNGWLVSEKKEWLHHNVKHANISLDGPQEVHDQVRGEGAYEKAVESVRICQSMNISVSLQCVLNRYNLNCVDETVNTAKQLRVPIMFQPATKWLSSSLKENPIAPDTKLYRETIRHIVELKRGGAPIRNSFTGLRHLAMWPDPQPIFCVAGRTMAIVEPDGSLLSCHQHQIKQFLDRNALKGSFLANFSQLDLPKRCVQCWCAPIVELCLFFSLHPEAMVNAFRYR